MRYVSSYSGAERYGQVKKEKRSAKANGLTTQCDKKRVLLNFKKWRPEPTQKNGAYSEKPYE